MLYAARIFPGGVAVDPFAPPRDWPDSVIRRPLWEVQPSEVKAVLHERRRRFGIEDERIDPADLTDEDLEDASE
ncbi:hypothetical protein [Streptomyces sp. NPDC000851]